MQIMYKPSEIIGLPMEGGGPHDGGLGKLKVKLYHSFKESCRSSYCTEVDNFSILLSVSGSICQYGSECIKNVRHSRKLRIIHAEVVIPVEAWEGKTPNELKLYLSRRVREALVCCIDRAIKNKLIIDKDALLMDIDKGIKSFTEIEYSLEDVRDPFIEAALAAIDEFRARKSK